MVNNAHCPNCGGPLGSAWGAVWDDNLGDLVDVCLDCQNDLRAMGLDPEDDPENRDRDPVDGDPDRAPIEPETGLPVYPSYRPLPPDPEDVAGQVERWLRQVSTQGDDLA